MFECVKILVQYHHQIKDVFCDLALELKTKYFTMEKLQFKQKDELLTRA